MRSSASRAAGADTINPAVEYATAPSTANDGRTFTLGYEFTTSVALDVNALGYFDDGNGNSHDVGIWTSSGTLLASTTVTGGDPVVGHFVYQSIPDLMLAPGTYVIGGQYLGDFAPIPVGATGVVTIPGYTWVTDLQQQDSSLTFPTVSTGAPSDRTASWRPTSRWPRSPSPGASPCWARRPWPSRPAASCGAASGRPRPDRRVAVSSRSDRGRCPPDSPSRRSQTSAGRFA